MKYLLIFTCCLLNFSLFAQEDSSLFAPNKRMKEESYAKKFEEKLSKTESKLNKSIKLYAEVEEEDKNLVKAKCKSYLFQIFDLGIEKRERQIVRLKSELERIGKRDQNIDKFNDLIAIKEEIEAVQQEIFRRKKHRDTIVENRLKEILP